MFISRNQRPGAIRQRHGTAALEFALILPLLLTLVLGCIDFGRFAQTSIVVTNAARAGAALGSSHPYTTATWSTWQAKVLAAVAEEMATLNGFDGTLLSVTSTTVSEADGGWRVEVVVSYPYQCLAPWPGIPANITVQQMVVMRLIRP